MRTGMSTGAEGLDSKLGLLIPMGKEEVDRVPFGSSRIAESHVHLHVQAGTSFWSERCEDF